MNKFGKFFQRCTALCRPGVLLAFGLVFNPASGGSAERALRELVSIPRRGTELKAVDRETGGTLLSLSVQITLPDGVECDFQGGSGLAVNPQTDELFALLNCGPDGPRLLAVIDTADGQATVLGNTGDFFAGIAFSSEGTLFAVTGNGADSPNTLYTMSPIDATVSPVCQLPQQPMFAGGQAIAFNPDDGLLYHASGNAETGGTRIFQSIDDVTHTDPIAPCPVTPRGPTGDGYNEASALVYSGASFYLTDVGNVSENEGRFYSMSNEGVATLIGEMDHISKGLALIRGPAEICYRVKRDDAAGPNESVGVEDAIVGPRLVLLKLKEAFTVCVPSGLQFIRSSTVPPGSSAVDEGGSVVRGRICYRVKNDDSAAANKTDLEVEDEGSGKRTVRIKTRKAFVLCDNALINTNALP